MRDVVKIYSTAAGNFDALKGVNLQVGAGEFVGIVGKSGAWFDYNDAKIGQGWEATKVYLKENPNVLDEIDKKVRVKVAEVEV